MGTLRTRANNGTYSVRVTLRWTLLLLLIAMCGVPAHQANAQSTEKAFEQERLTTERFLQVLMRRPRPGTALDRVYGFHVRHDTLDNFLNSLTVPDDEEHAGPKAFIKGLLELQRGKPANATEALAVAEKRLPEDAACSYYLGKAYLAVGQTELAAEAIERAIDRNPSRTEALPIYTELGRIYSRAGLPEKSLKVWTRLEEVFPGDDRVAARIAQTLVDEGNLDEALKRYEQLAESARRDDEKIKFAVEAAEIRRRLGKTEQATRDLETILARLRPGSWLYNDVRNRIEAGFLESGDTNALADYYLNQLESNPDDLELRTRLGRILISAGRIEDAEDVLEEAVDLAPKNPAVRLTLIDVLVNKSDFTGAISHFSTLVEQDPENPDYLLRWGRLLLDEPGKPLDQRRDSAARIWQRLAAARADDAVTLSQIADRMRSIDRTEDAIQLYQKAIEADPTSPQYREYLGEYLHRLERTDEAIEIWESIATEDRRSRESLVRLAEVFSTFGMPERALDTWKQAGELDLTFAQELRFADALRQAEDYTEALKRLDAAERIAESPEEREQLLKNKIRTYSEAGTLEEQIAKLEDEPESATGSIKLALMYEAANNTVESTRAINHALALQPDNVAVMSIAAEIAEHQDRLADAIDLLTRLTVADPRFQSNYLQRISGLQLSLGEVEEALATCERLIDFNPASPDSYQFFARTAFSIGRDEKAFDALNRAMNVARRDNGPRNMLASAYAERYRTDEAIELYWQSFDIERDLENKLSLVKRLATLYERKGEIEVLIERLKEQGIGRNEARSTQLLIAEAYETVGNYGAAQEVITPLLAANPQDVDLLTRMVSLADQANDVRQAAEYQQQIVTHADTPENRFRLLQLQVDAGMIDTSEAIAARVSLSSDPEHLGYLIRSSTRRGDLELAIGLCRETLNRDDTLWDVKLMLAQLLLHQSGKEAEKSHKEARQLITEIQQANYAPDSPAPTSSKSNKSRMLTGASSQVSSPIYWSQIGYSLAQTYRIGPYANQNFTISSRSNTVEPTNFAHARFLADALELVHLAKSFAGEELKIKVGELFEEKHSLPPLEQVNDPYQLLEFEGLRGLASTLASFTPDEKEAGSSIDRTWRLAELDPELGSHSVMQIMLTRSRQVVTADNPSKEQEPLPEERLKTLERVCLATKNSPSSLTNFYPQLYRDLFLGIAAHELIQGGHPERARQFMNPTPGDDATIDELLLATISTLAIPDEESSTEALLERLVVAARKEAENRTLSSSTLQQNLQMLTGYGNHLQGNNFVKQHEDLLVELILLSAVPSNSQSRTLSQGSTSIHIRNSQGNYVNLPIKIPFSNRLFESSVLSTLSNLEQQLGDKEKDGKPDGKVISDRMLAHFDDWPAEATSAEIKMRRSLLAFADWWNDDSIACFKKLTALCEDFPDDVDLLIERARLASELAMPRKALEILDSFTPLDSDMLIRKEMAAMNLADQLGDTERAELAAERLYGLRMAPQIQLALIEQLRSLDMNERATAMLQRLRSGGRKQNELTQLSIAQSFLKAGDKQAAAEVAYSLLKQVNRARSNQNNQNHYRNQAYAVLRSAGRLDGLIETAERQLKSTPKSTRLKEELAQLYTAAGREEEASELWGNLSEDESTNPSALIRRAQTLASAKKHAEALDVYLDAFRLSPQLLDRHIYQMRNVAQQSKDYDKIYKAFAEIDISQVQTYRIRELLGWSNDVTAEKKQLVAHILEGTGKTRYLTEIMQAIPDSHISQYPILKEAILEKCCSPAAFEYGGAGLWAARSYSSAGRINGSLAPILGLLKSDQQALEKFMEVAEQAQTEEATKPTADLLIALVSLDSEDKQPQVVEALLDVKKLAEKQKSDAPQSSGTAAQAAKHINELLLWQAGQVLEGTAVEEKHPEIIVAFLNAAVGVTSHSDFEYSVKRRLVDAYKKSGQFDEARKLILEAFKQADHSQQNVHNPGYGDYQDLRDWKSLADNLVELDYPIDGISIYQHALQDPARFERAKRWGGAPVEKAYTDAMTKAREQVTVEQAIQHLQHLDLDKAKAGSLLSLSLETIRSGNYTTSFSIAVEHALQNDAGLEELRKLDSRLQEIESKSSPRWIVTAPRLLLRTIIEPEQSVELKDRLFNELPSLENEEAIQQAAQEYSQLASLAEAASVLIKQPQQEAKQTSRELVDYLAKLADHAQDTEALLALTSLTGSIEDVSKIILERMDPPEGSDVTVSFSDIDSCLEIAERAARKQDLELSTRALRIALQNGPPQRSRVTSRGNAFAMGSATSASSTSSSAEEAEKLDELSIRLNDLLDLYSTQFGLELGSSAVAAASSSDAKAGQAENLNLIYEALEAAVLPANHKKQVFPYTVPIVSARGYDRNQEDGFQIRSLLVALAQVAAQSDKTEVLTERLKSRFPSQGESLSTENLLIHLSLATKSDALLGRGLEQFSKQADKSLPPLKETTKPTFQSGMPISSTMQLESFHKSELLSETLLGLWPLVEKQELSREQKKQVFELLQRMLMLIESDHYTDMRHYETANILRRRLLNHLASQGEQKKFQSVLERQLAAIERYYARYDPQSRQANINNATERLIRELTEDGHSGLLPDLIREKLESLNGAGLDNNSIIPGMLCLDLAQLPLPKRFAALKKISLGNETDRKLMHWGGVVRYELPPRMMQHKTTRLEEIQALPICTAKFPLADTILLLADAATELNVEDELEKELASLSENSFDNAELAAALVQITSLRAASSDPVPESFLATVNAVQQKLQETLPKENDKTLRIPILETYLAARLTDFPKHSEQAAEMLKLCRTHAVRGQDLELVSAINRLLGKRSLPPEESLSEGSPLEHFVAIELPRNNSALLNELPPIYSYSEEGGLVATSGTHLSLLTLKYPVQGLFEFSADIQNGHFADADLAYGGVIYHANGWAKRAQVTGINRGQVIKVPLETPFKTFGFNREALQGGEQEIKAIVNDHEYVSDQRIDSYPWLSVIHQQMRRSNIKNIQLSGKATIPREVNLLSPSMRGWAITTFGRGLPNLQLPTGPNQTAKQIQQSHQNTTAQPQPQAMGGNWRVHDDMLHYHSRSNSNGWDPHSHIQYLRPLLDGETIKCSFWWNWGNTELHPAIGRLRIALHRSGAKLIWIPVSGDLATATSSIEPNAPDPQTQNIASDNVPIDDAWNTFTMTRHGETVEIQLNEKPLLQLEITANARPGLIRHVSRDVKVRSMTLSGDWPETMPENLLEPKRD